MKITMTVKELIKNADDEFAHKYNYDGKIHQSMKKLNWVEFQKDGFDFGKSINEITPILGVIYFDKEEANKLHISHLLPRMNDDILEAFITDISTTKIKIVYESSSTIWHENLEEEMRCTWGSSVCDFSDDYYSYEWILEKEVKEYRK